MGIKWIFNEVEEHTRWLFGNGKDISAWNDKWVMEKTSKEIYPENNYIKQFPDMKVSDFILDGEWILPTELLEMIGVNELRVLNGDRDRRIWTGTVTGDFTISSEVEVIRQKFHQIHWTKQVWDNSFHPSISCNLWKLARNITATDDNMKKRKFNIASRCILCKNEEETREHILWYCNFSEIIWKWLGGIFSFRNPRSFEDILQLSNQKSHAIKETWRLASFITMKELWFLINECLYDNGKCDVLVIKRKILNTISDSEVRIKAVTWNSQYDLQVLRSFGLKSRRVKRMTVKEVFFSLPAQGQLLLCCDGASRENPGASGYGIFGRNSTGEFIIAISGGLGISTNYYAKIYAVIIAGKWAIHNEFFNIVLRTDSKAVIQAFASHKLPWFAIARWRKICSVMTKWSFIHNYREVNFSADKTTKKGSTLNRGEKNHF
ncbi:uncharacterized protein LOC113306300 [Papaver somniferum]|uniref:uncharacterized protein LOC113306300 n=1 Tax=Papaver somniferum TaxID=3469 RepID=UPI000E701EA7|nr:uncharacterized protein LOC113306300 [Papaver somniferum]